MTATAPTSTSAHDGVTEAYLFVCGDEPLFAVSWDHSGANLPQRMCPEGWRFKLAFALGVQEVLPFNMSPEPILRGLRSVGYYVWREGYGCNPSGTSQ
jgi:hypothetical protein